MRSNAVTKRKPLPSILVNAERILPLIISLSCLPLAAQQNLPSNLRKTGAEVVSAFEPQRAAMQKCSAVLVSGRKELVYGVVVSSDGLILTKASEVQGITDLEATVDRTRYKDAKVIAIDPVWDVALVKVDAEGLEPVTSELQEWYCIEQAKVQLLYQDALRGHYQVLAMADDIQGAIRVARVLLELDPLDEYTHQRIMQLELFRGNLKGAMQQFETCCQKLSSLLGVEPLAETRELADIIDALLFDQQLFSEDDSFKEEFKDGLF